ncbi:MAG: diguanylate cyclase, partial [Eubacteriales bacterium]|nr:diguanylate cyclase [Eubacteriales bacterium]
FATNEEMTQALQSGTVDSLLSSSLRARTNEWTIDSFDEAPIYVAVRKGDTRTLELINHALDRMEIEENHWMVTLMQRYYGDNESNIPFLTQEERAYLQEQNESGRVYRVLVNTDRYPYSYIANGEPVGIMIDLFDLIAKRCGIAYEWIIPKDREHYAQLITDKNTDICIDLTPDFHQAEEYGYSITDCYLTAPFSWIRRSDNMDDITTAAKLIYMAYSPAQYAYDNVYHEIDYITYATVDACLKSVIDKKTDGYCTYTYQAEQLVLQDLSNSLIATISQSENRFAIGVSHGINNHLTSILNTTVNCIEDWEVVDIIRHHTNLSTPTFSLFELLHSSPQFLTSAILLLVLVLLMATLILQRILHEKKLQKIIHMQSSKLDKSMENMLDVLATAIEFRSNESGDHVQRIRGITRDILNEVIRLYPEEYPLSPEDVQQISTAALMHDVGKIAIPDYILNKPGKLTPVEFETIKQHPLIGCELLDKIPNIREEQLYAYAYDICRWHHERWDGRGYPDGLKENQVPIWAQVAAVADVYDALISPRVYKKAFSHETAVQMILSGECGAFNPQVLHAFRQISEHLKLSSARKQETHTSAPVGKDLTTLTLSAFHCLLETTSDMIFLKDADLVYRSVSPAFAALLHRKPEEIVCHTISDLFGDDINARRYEAEDRQLLASGEDIVDYLEMVSDLDGNPIYGSTTKRLLTDAQGRVMGILGITRDVTPEYHAKKHHKLKLRYLYDLPADAYFAIHIDINQWRIIVENSHPVRGVVIGNHETIESLYLDAIKGMAEKRGSAYGFFKNFNAEALQELYNGGRSEIVMEYLHVMPNGTQCWIRDEIEFLIDPANGHLCLVMVVRDIQAKKEAELNVIRMAEHDALTGLLNRASIRMLVDDVLSGNDPLTARHALFMIDMDNLKGINDYLGHKTGDDELIRLGRTLCECFRSTDLVARVGGDEFVVFMRFITDADSVQKKADQLAKRLYRILDNSAGSLATSSSIGISLYPDDGRTLTELYEKADQAMYHAKNSGKNKAVFFRDIARK